MSNWYYYDKHAKKLGPYDFGQLRWLALTGVVTPKTFVESEKGKSLPAKNVKGLVFAEATQEEAETHKKRRLYISILGLIFLVLLFTGAWKFMLLTWLIWGGLVAIALLPLMLTVSSRRVVSDMLDSLMSDQDQS